jgi:hypothetical protein
MARPATDPGPDGFAAAYAAHPAPTGSPEAGAAIAEVIAEVAESTAEEALSVIDVAVSLVEVEQPTTDNAATAASPAAVSTER